MGAVVIEHSFAGKPSEETMYDWIEEAAADDAEARREMEIEYWMEEVLPEENPGVHEDDLYEMACDRVDMANDYLIYPGNWAAYHGGCHLHNGDAPEDPEEKFWSIVDNKELVSWNNTSKWDDNVFYFYDAEKDETKILALVPC
ncbi:hypothetical protein N9N32_00320 [Alphaproteobacteria bacterium]|nr:hypothetical protein [Alphaproteobacteria bacterium]